MTSEQQKNEEKSISIAKNIDFMLSGAVIRNTGARTGFFNGVSIYDIAKPIEEALNTQQAAHEKSLTEQLDKSEKILHETEDLAEKRFETYEKSLQLLTQERDTEIKRARNAEASLAEKEKRIEVLEGALKYYADSDNYCPKPFLAGTKINILYDDKGKIAKKALSTPMTGGER